MTLGMLVIRYAFRRKIRLALTLGGIASVVLSFALLQSTLDAWRSGIGAAMANRLITVHAISEPLHIPRAYREKIATIPGVVEISYANWFGGQYKDGRDYFTIYAVEPASYLAVYPEYLLAPTERDSFIRDRMGCLAGRKLAARFGWKVGDVIPLQGTLYPGDWNFVLHGIYRGAEPKTDETLMLIHWEAMNERRKVIDPERAGNVSWYVTKVADASLASSVATTIDSLFANSLAETRTATEEAFEMGLVDMSGGILTAMQIMAIVVNGITLLVLANVLIMGIRERTRDYAVMKTLGFRAGQLAPMIVGESLIIAALGAALGVGLTVAGLPLFGGWLQGIIFFPVFSVHLKTLSLTIMVTLLVAAIAAAGPAVRLIRMAPTDGLRHLG